jgi:hypothetical protein
MCIVLLQRYSDATVPADRRSTLGSETAGAGATDTSGRGLAGRRGVPATRRAPSAPAVHTVYLVSSATDAAAVNAALDAASQNRERDNQLPLAASVLVAGSPGESAIAESAIAAAKDHASSGAAVSDIPQIVVVDLRAGPAVP